MLLHYVMNQPHPRLDQLQPLIVKDLSVLSKINAFLKNQLN